MKNNELAGKFIQLFDLLWGDNAKGSIALRLAKLLKEKGLKIKWAIKPNGGGNSGHSYRNERGIFCKSHNLPLAVFDPDITAIIGAGTVIDPKKMKTEMQTLNGQGVDVSQTIIDPRAQIILPVYKTLEKSLEKIKGKDNIGTTANAIGPTYAMQAFRFGPTFNDLLSSRMRAEEKLKIAYNLTNAYLRGCNLPEQTFDLDQILELAKFFANHIHDTFEIFQQIRNNGEIGIIEPGQGVLLDRIFGTYPYVTSSLTTPGGLLGHAGLSIKDISFTLGIAKLYTTRVGSGPFPGENHEFFSERVRQNGNEYGVTTRRPRRCGPIDYVLLRHAIRMTRPNLVAFTKLDALDNLEHIPIIDSWTYDCQSLKFPPADIEKWFECQTNEKTFDGWIAASGQCRRFEELPEQAKNYIYNITSDWQKFEFDSLLSMITVGEKLDQMIALAPLLEQMGI